MTPFGRTARELVAFAIQSGVEPQHVLGELCWMLGEAIGLAADADASHAITSAGQLIRARVKEVGKDPKLQAELKRVYGKPVRP